MKWLMKMLQTLAGPAPMGEPIAAPAAVPCPPPARPEIALTLAPGLAVMSVVLSNGETHAWLWEFGREQKLMTEIAQATARGETGLRWDDAAALTNVIREVSRSPVGNLPNPHHAHSPHAPKGSAQ